ncbi:uncharacterized protein [Henckelia pumila]|uniref:uncharacterized protein n=1 Tax=Henckelia pumila TaxID=405737 RepID=UPI003C6E0758
MANGVSADHLNEYLRIGESTIIKCLFKFCEYVVEIFDDRYLRRPNADDVQCLLQMHDERHQFSGMLEWVTCVKVFPCPEDPKRKLFKERQESTRKDVERAFGVLQS